jgi:hypothetical protein
MHQPPIATPAVSLRRDCAMPAIMRAPQKPGDFLNRLGGTSLKNARRWQVVPGYHGLADQNSPDGSLNVTWRKSPHVPWLGQHKAAADSQRFGRVRRIGEGARVRGLERPWAIGWRRRGCAVCDWLMPGRQSRLGGLGATGLSVNAARSASSLM